MLKKVKEYCKENKRAIVGSAAIGAGAGLCAYAAYKVGVYVGSMGTILWLNTTFKDLHVIDRLDEFLTQTK